MVSPPCTCKHLRGAGASAYALSARLWQPQIMHACMAVLPPPRHPTASHLLLVAAVGQKLVSEATRGAMAEGSRPSWEHLPSSLLCHIAGLMSGSDSIYRAKTLLRLVCSSWSVSLPISEGAGRAEKGLEKL